MAELKKSLSYAGIIALTITSMVGTAMFFGTAIGARYSGNGVLIAWLILIAISTYVAACFGELIALFPTAGGVYEFSKQAYGGFISFIIGWTTWLMSNVAITVLTIAALDYIVPPESSAALKYGLAIGIILLFNIVAYLGVDISGAVLTFFAIESIFLFLLIIIPGLGHIKPANFDPFFSKPIENIFVSLFFMVEALMGWEAASFLAEETKNPGKVIPKALIVTTLVAGLLGLGIAIVSLGVIRWDTLSELSAPVTEVAFEVLGTRGTNLVAWGIVLSLLGSAIGAIISTPRLLLAMARDKVFPAQLGAVHPVRNTPYNAIIFQTFVSIIIVVLASGQYEFLLSIFTPLSLIMYISIILVVPILRLSMPNAPREFKVPFGKIGPILISLLYLGVIFAWILLTPNAYDLFKIVLSLIFFGMPIYLMMIFFYNQDAVVVFLDTFSWLTLIFERLFLPKRIKNEILSQIKDISDKTILEYGASVGTLTIPLSKAVGPKGKLFATELSRGNFKILKRRLEKRKITNVKIIQDDYHTSRINPSIENVDAVFSVGDLSYMQDPVKILKEMNRILPESGRLCIVEYVNFFGLLPDKEWISDEEKLKDIFRQAGFSVRIEKRKSLLWNYLFIFGVKSKRDVPVI